MGLAVAALLVGLGVGLAQTTPGETSEVNRIQNPGLEADTDRDGIPDHWGVPRPSAYPADRYPEGLKPEFGICDVARRGKHSITYTLPARAIPHVATEDAWDHAAWARVAKTTVDHWAVAFKTDNFPVTEYRLYRIRCWVKAEGILDLHIKFISTFIYPGQDKPVERWTLPLLNDARHRVRRSGTWDWELFEATVPIPEYVEHGRIEFWVHEWAAPAKLYCDDMSVVEVGPYPFFERRKDR